MTDENNTSPSGEISQKLADETKGETGSEININKVSKTTTYNNEPKKYTPDGVDFTFAILTMVLAYFYIRLVFLATVGVGLLVFSIMFALVCLGYCYSKTKKLPVSALPYFGLSIIGAIPALLYSSTQYSGITVLIVSGFAVYGVIVATKTRLADDGNQSNDNKKDFANAPQLDTETTDTVTATDNSTAMFAKTDFFPNDCINAGIYRPFMNFGAFFSSLLSGKKVKKESRNLLTVLAAVAITVVLVFVCANTLSAVDENFAKIVSFFTGNWHFSISESLWTIFLAFPVGLYFFGLFFGSVNKTKLNRKNANEILTLRANRKATANILFVLPMLALTVIYFTFFISHIVTLYNAFTFGNILYSEYARKGFFELCGISALNLCLCFTATALTKKSEITPKIIKILNCIIALCTLILMATASGKLLLYIHYYGLTLRRFHAAWALVMILVIFILFFVRQFKNFPFFKTSALIVAISYIVLSLCGITTIVAKYNFTQYEKGELSQFTIDDVHEYRDAAAPYLIKEWNNKNSHFDKLELAYSLKNYPLHSYSEDDVQKTLIDLGGFNIQREKARNLREPYAKETRKYIDKEMNSEIY